MKIKSKQGLTTTMEATREARSASSMRPPAELNDTRRNCTVVSKRTSRADLVICILLLCLVGLGCTMLREARRVDPLDGNNPAMAAKRIKETIGGDPRLISVEIRRDRMEMTVRSATNPKDIDKYRFKDGVVHGPEPVQVLTLGDLEMSGDKYNTISIDEVAWDAIPGTIGRAVELSKLEDARVHLISMEFNYAGHTEPRSEGQRAKPFDRSNLVFTWRLFVEGPRGRKDFWADNTGKLNEKPF